LQRDEVFGFKFHIVVDRLVKAGVHRVVFAGAAAYCYGSERKVTDVDILVEDLEKAEAVLADVEDVDVVADLKIKVWLGRLVSFSWTRRWWRTFRGECFSMWKFRLYLSKTV
jgi:hypothetical protein